MRRSVPIWVMVVALAVTILVGIGAYNAGVSEGLAQNIDAGGGNAELVRHVRSSLPPPGRGFGFFPVGLILFPLLFFGFFVFMGAAFGRGARWGGPGPWGGGPGRGDERRAFEDWHRRQHERPSDAHQTGGEPAEGSTT
jgi:hypothetical protein